MGTATSRWASSASFKIRAGSVNGVAIGGVAPSPTATPTAGPTNSPTPTPTAVPSSHADAGSGRHADDHAFAHADAYRPSSSTSTATQPAPTHLAAAHPAPRWWVQPTLTVKFVNTTTGASGLDCVWTFGDGGSSTSCSSNVYHSYYSHGSYNVTLTMDGSHSKTRTSYVLVACQVPAFAGVRKNSASAVWQAAGFSYANITLQDGNGNYKIGYQSLAGGLVNPTGGCSGATIQVGP